MKNKFDDIIFKYLSDLLDGNEKKEFESAMEKNSVLKNQYETVKKSLEDLKQLIPVESQTSYFDNLVPNIRKRMGLRRPGKIFSATVQKAIGFGLAAVLVLIVVFQNGNGTYEFNLELVTSTLESASSDELNEFVEVRYSDLENYDIISEIDLEIYSNAINEQMAINNEDMNDFIGYSYFGLDGIGDISESEENEIYSSLFDKKIL